MGASSAEIDGLFRAFETAPVVEAMTACVLADAFLRHRGQTGGGAFAPGREGRSQAGS